MSGNKVIFNIKPKNKINMEVLPPSLSLTDVERAENAANVAMAWAQDAGSPDGENDTDSPTGKTQSSKSWALNAKNNALSAAASASAAATSETNAANSEDKAQAWAESETSPDGEPDSKSAKTWAGESSDSAELAQKWAESDESPDGEVDSKSAKTWAEEAAQAAAGVGNPVANVTESNGTVTVEKSDGTSSSFDIPQPTIATQEEAEAGTDNTKFMTPLRTKEAIEAQVQGLPGGIEDYVVETYKSGSNWYRKYKSGWVEQGGIFSLGAAAKKTVTFLQSFSDTNMYLNISDGIVSGGWSAAEANNYIISVTKTNFMFCQAYNRTCNFKWFACGYGE